jgi:hypothetical protein
MQEETEDGISHQFLRIKAGSTMTINYPLFKKSMQDGKVIKLIFRTSHCRDYDALALSCKSDFMTSFIDMDLEDASEIPQGTSLSYAGYLKLDENNNLSLRDPQTVDFDLFNEEQRELLHEKYILYKSKIHYCFFKEVEDSNPKITYVCLYPVSVVSSFKGLQVNAQSASFRSTSSSVTTQYCEDSYIELTIDITKADPKAIKNYIKVWINGVPSGFVVYDSNDNYIDYDQHPITIGSPDCDVDLYLIKVYEKQLSNQDHLNNFIADAPDAKTMVARFNRNNILDAERGDISPKKLALANPDCLVHLYEIERIPTAKKDKVYNCTYDQYHGTDTSVLHADNVTIKV